MKNVFKVLIGAFVVSVVGLTLFIRSCMSSINEVESDTRAFFQLIVDQGSQVAYDQTSDYFKSATTFEDFDAFVNDADIVNYVDFQAFGYETSIKSGVSTKTVNGTLTFNDGSSFDIYFDWVKVGEEWEVLGFGGAQ